MRIAVDVLSIRPDGSAGGATGFAIELIKGFSSIKENTVFALCADWNMDYLKSVLPSNVKLVPLETPQKATGISLIDRMIFRFFHKFREEKSLKNEQIDILYCPFSSVANKLQGVPVVSTILDIQHEYYPQFFSAEELNHRQKFYKDIVKKAEAVTCISNYTRDTFCEKYMYPQERAHTIYIAIQNRFEQEDSSILSRLQIEEHKYIIYPANFWEHKNHKLLLCAFAIYLQENPEAILVLTGNPLEQKEYYKNLMNELGIQNQVRVTGYLSNAELHSILKNAKGLIFPSLFEGFGIPIVEAMQQHLLIACSNLTSLPEIGCDGICYFNPKRPDDIVAGFRYLYNNEMTPEIITSYEEKLKSYQTDHMVQQYLTLFDEVILDKKGLVFDECCNGIYADSWAGESICLQLKSRIGSTLRLSLELPTFVSRTLKFHVENSAWDTQRKKYKITPGEHLEIEEKIHEENTVIRISFAGCWSPKTTLHSEDSRQLSVLVNNISIVDSSNCSTQLHIN